MKELHSRTVLIITHFHHGGIEIIVVNLERSSIAFFPTEYPLDITRVLKTGQDVNKHTDAYQQASTKQLHHHAPDTQERHIFGQSQRNLEASNRLPVHTKIHTLEENRDSVVTGIIVGKLKCSH